MSLLAEQNNDGGVNLTGDLSSINLDQLTLFSYNPLTELLKSIIAKLKQQENDLKHTKDELRDHKKEAQRQKITTKKQIANLNARITKLENSSQNDTKLDDSSQNNDSQPTKFDNSSGDSKLESSSHDDDNQQTEPSENPHDDEELTGTTGGALIDADEYADLVTKSDKNRDDITDMKSEFDKLNDRINNLVSLMRTVSEIAKNAERIGDEAKKKADHAHAQSSKAIDEANDASQRATQASDAASEAQRSALASDRRARDAHDEAQRASQRASQASEAASDAQKLAQSNQEHIDENSKSIKDLYEKIKNINTSLDGFVDRMDKITKDIDDTNKTANNNRDQLNLLNKSQRDDLDQLKKQMDDSMKDMKEHEMKAKLAPPVPVKEPKIRQKLDPELATRKEVQLLRNVVVRCENDIRNLYDFIENNQPDVVSSQQYNQPRGSDQGLKDNSKDRKSSNTTTTTTTTTTKTTKKAPQSQTDTKQSDSSNISQTDDSKNTPTRRLPSRDIRSQYMNISDDENDRLERQDKIYNTLAVTLNEVLGRVDVLEAAVAELQALFDQLQSSMRDSRPLSSHGGSGADSEQVEQIFKLLNQKADKSTNDSLKNQIQDLSSLLKKLQHELENKANRDDVPNMEQFRDLENKVVKKVDRKEMQSLISKLMSNQAQREQQNNITFSPPTKRSSNKKTANDTHLDDKTLSDIEKLKEAINSHTHDLNTLFKTKADKSETFKDLSDFKETLDRLEQVKADANIVARKAEREYVDNIMDKLKRDLENYVNNTNAHTSDLFAKDLEFLKGLLDQKAGKGDLKKLKEMLKRLSGSQEAVKTTDGGLAGYKKFRCLSCNREMESMRVRPLSMSFMNFVNHLPNPKSRLYPRKAFVNDPRDSMRSTKSGHANGSSGEVPHEQEQYDTNMHTESRALPPINK